MFTPQLAYELLELHQIGVHQLTAEAKKRYYTLIYEFRQWLFSKDELARLLRAYTEAEQLTG